MTLDLITWAPEVQLCCALLLLLWYGTGPVILSVGEGWWMPSFCLTASKKNTVKLSSFKEAASSALPVAGPGPITAHLSWWTIIWCVLGAFLVWNNPFFSLQAGGVFLRDF